ncbi:MAG TPA: NUDIX domain-containing protein, partial [Anaerolineales bacterium]|nr:NUDIX domain-containing protein [Anaerolineales bacterium]
MMVRAAFQVIVFPYRFAPSGQPEYAIFFRRTPRHGDFWQAIAGGGEDDESPPEAALREANEESGLSYQTEYLQLDSMATIPAPQA